MEEDPSSAVYDHERKVSLRCLFGLQLVKAWGEDEEPCQSSEACQQGTNEGKRDRSRATRDTDLFQTSKERLKKLAEVKLREKQATF